MPPSLVSPHSLSSSHHHCRRHYYRPRISSSCNLIKQPGGFLYEIWFHFLPSLLIHIRLHQLYSSLIRPSTESVHWFRTDFVYVWTTLSPSLYTPCFSPLILVHLHHHYTWCRHLINVRAFLYTVYFMYVWWPCSCLSNYIALADAVAGYRLFA